MNGLEHRAEWEAGVSPQAYLSEHVVEHRALWEGVYRGAVVPPELLARAAAAGGPWRLLVLSEDWCGDASNTVPVLARLAEAAPNVEMRVLKRDEHPALMDAYLTNGARSIPLAIVLDGGYRPVGRWGPRPAALQAWVLAEKAAGTRPPAELYREVRRWYARDHGRTTLEEVVSILETAAGAERRAA